MPTEETAPPETEQQQTETPAAPEANETPAGPTGYDAFAAWAKEQEDNPELETHLASLKPESFGRYDPAAQAALLAVHRAEAKREAEREATWKAKEEERQKRDSEFAARERELKRKEAALLAVAASAKPPGEAPKDDDPFSPEAVAKRQEYLAQKAVWEAQAPLREEAKKKDIDYRWDLLCDKFTDLRKDKIANEFGEWLQKRNEGAKGLRLTAEDGAEIFFNERELARLRSETQRRQSEEDRTRAAAARNIGRSHGAGAPDKLAHYRKLRAQDPDAADEFLSSNPDVQRALMNAHNIATA